MEKSNLIYINRNQDALKTQGNPKGVPETPKMQKEIGSLCIKITAMAVILLLLLLLAYELYILAIPGMDSSAPNSDRPVCTMHHAFNTEREPSPLGDKNQVYGCEITLV